MALGPTQSVNKNEYQEYLLAGKGGRCVWLTTVPPIRVRHEIWEPQLSGTSGPVQGLLYLLPRTSRVNLTIDTEREREREREGGRPIVYSVGFQPLGARAYKALSFECSYVSKKICTVNIGFCVIGFV